MTRATLNHRIAALATASLWASLGCLAAGAAIITLPTPAPAAPASEAAPDAATPTLATSDHAESAFTQAALSQAALAEAALADAVPDAPVSATKPQLDRSGRPQTGKASFYADRYAGRAMADGTPMSLYSNNAASKTLPLGSTARVINLESGLSALVTIRDRGPYVAGRIIDLSPATARKIGLDRRRGLARVVVVPLTVPLPDGTVKIMPAAARMAAN